MENRFICRGEQSFHHQRKFCIRSQGQCSFFWEQDEKKRTVIVTSDIASGSSSELVISAKRLSKMQGREKSGSMSKLLSLLREIDVTQIAIAGMDGFSDNSEDNYFDQSLMVKRTLEEVKVINERWQKDLDDFMQQYRGTYHVQLITPSLLKID